MTARDRHRGAVVIDSAYGDGSTKAASRENVAADGARLSTWRAGSEKTATGQWPGVRRKKELDWSSRLMTAESRLKRMVVAVRSDSSSSNRARSPKCDAS